MVRGNSGVIYGVVRFCNTLEFYFAITSGGQMLKGFGKLQSERSGHIRATAEPNYQVQF